MGDIADLFDKDVYSDDDGYTVRCKRCGEEGLEWIHSGVRWRLIDGDGKPHVCKNDNAIDDFEVLA